MVASLSRTNLMAANSEWASRPDDERFWDLQELHAHCLDGRTNCREVRIVPNQLSVVAGDNQLLAEYDDQQYRLNHWSTSQICQSAGLPMGVATRLNTELAANCLNRLLRQRTSEDNEWRLLVREQDDQTSARGFTGPRYSRLWNTDITARLQDLQSMGWRTPPARPVHDGGRTRIATEGDCLGTSLIKPGDVIGPAGLYAGDRDMWVFMVNEDHRINDGSDGGLARGFFLWNSEVGARSFGITFFLYRYVCGNHIVWDAAVSGEIRIRHVGSCDDRAFSAIQMELKRYLDISGSQTEAKIEQAKIHLLGEDKDEVLDMIFGRKIASRADTDKAFELATSHETVDPRSAWGLAQGFTRLSQQGDGASYADARVGLDTAASKVLALLD